jgi:hypothetical protein
MDIFVVGNPFMVARYLDRLVPLIPAAAILAGGNIGRNGDIVANIQGIVRQKPIVLVIIPNIGSF